MTQNVQIQGQAFDRVHKQLPQDQNQQILVTVRNHNSKKKKLIKLLILGFILFAIGLLFQETQLFQNNQAKKIDTSVQNINNKVGNNQQNKEKQKIRQIDITEQTIAKNQNKPNINQEKQNKKPKPFTPTHQILKNSQLQKQSQIFNRENHPRTQLLSTNYTQQQLLQFQKSKKQALDKYQSNGLKQYYQKIQQQIKIAKIYTNKDNQISKYVYIVNNIEQNNTEICENQINYVKGQNTPQNIQFLCVFKKQITTQKLQNFVNEKQMNISMNIQKLNSTYNFISKYIGNNIQWVIFNSRNYFILQQQEKQKIFYNNKIVYILGSAQLSSSVQYINLSEPKNEQQFLNSTIIFKKQILNVIAPLNFAVQDVYTFQQLITLPIIATAQLANKVQYIKINPNNKINKKIQITINKTQFIFSKLSSKQNKHICFIANPTDLNINSQSQLNYYLSNFQDQLYIFNKYNYTMSIFLSIIYPSTQNIQNIIQKILRLSNSNIQIKIYLQLNKIYPPLQAYRASYAYCPQKSIIFNSRMNIHPIIQNLTQSLNKTEICHNKKQWILVGNYYTNLQKFIQLPKLPNYNMKFRNGYINSYKLFFENAQIYCQDIMRQMRLQLVKWQQLQFYQTQASYSIPLAQRCAKNITQVSTALYKISYTRDITQKQRKQINNLPLRAKLKAKPQDPLYPIQYSQLNNYAFKRYPKQQIPRILHQIWLSSSKKISQIRKQIAETIIKTNPTFQYKLWTWENVTRQQFPITYDGILKFQQIQKQRKKNLKALVADLMRIQVLYKYGGIYFDLKIEGKKSLQPFLKYQQFWLIANQQNLVNGLIGSIKGNRHFRIMLQDYFKPSMLHAPIHHIYQMTGGTKLIQAYTKKQLYTQLMNFNQFILQGPRPCVLTPSHQALQQDQKVFQGMTAFTVKTRYRIYIPCKKDMDKYLQLYDILGRTYLPGNPDFN